MSATFQGTLGRNLEYGHSLEICAKAQHDGNWFNITLASQIPEYNNIEMGFQMIVYLNNNAIELRTVHNEWKEEVNHVFTTSSFFTQFKINIVMSEHNFNIAINNQPWSHISYSLPLDMLNSIKISGDLDYIKQVDHRKYFPFTWPPLQLTEDSVDFSNDQPMSFQAGHVMIINAQLLGNDNGRFVLQLKNAHNSQREELHMSVRFDTQTFVRNSKTTKCIDKRTSVEYLGYGEEETDGGFPFDDFYRPFKLAVAFTETEFYIAKDGQFFCRFRYRTPNVLSDIVGLKIIGIDGVSVRVNGIDHLQMNDPQCIGFESYSSI
ncbi:uncharacterized protein ACRADG_012105 [Cochliomyia hominivorax]